LFQPEQLFYRNTDLFSMSQFSVAPWQVFISKFYLMRSHSAAEGDGLTTGRQPDRANSRFTVP